MEAFVIQELHITIDCCLVNYRSKYWSLKLFWCLYCFLRNSCVILVWYYYWYLIVIWLEITNRIFLFWDCLSWWIAKDIRWDGAWLERWKPNFKHIFFGSTWFKRVNFKEDRFKPWQRKLYRAWTHSCACP